ncbi:MAG: hydrogenase iron-sulfur subunit [Candidatus Bathyarchaeota archaeon]|nr:hydrogenase iron-sulfur subunit [Candidatus Bathyarchaeota archaeon]MDH5688245.1 hydrogenase iron-sulfur subunit [Candidatus Bathyarchaeota archaeon]
MTREERFEPDIIGFLCNWCSYAGADLAGVSRFQYPPNVRIIRVMCSARVDPIIVLEAFTRGLDGVMVLGCHLGDCHYMTGNYYTETRIKTTREVLKDAGLSPERLLIDWVSAAEGERFAALVKEFTERVRKLGPLGDETDLELQQLRTRLIAAKATLAQERLRWLVGRERELVEHENVFGEKVSQEEFDQLMLQTIEKEFAKRRILLSMGEDALSVREIAQRVEASPGDVLRNMITLERDGFVSVVGIEGSSPMYRRAGR